MAELSTKRRRIIGCVWVAAALVIMTAGLLVLRVTARSATTTAAERPSPDRHSPRS
jgi:hypothetical protein